MHCGYEVVGVYGPPPSVVRKIVPLAPTTVPVFSSVVETAERNIDVPLD